jgi:DNA repair protein RadC
MPVKFKKGSKEAKAHMAKIRAMRGSGAGKHTDTKSHNVNVKVVSGTKKKSTTRQTGKSVIEKDYTKKALAPGKRKSASGNTYYERRANRSDKPGSLLGITGYKTKPEIIVGKIGSIKNLTELIPAVKVRITRGKSVINTIIKGSKDSVDVFKKFIGRDKILTQEFFAVMYLKQNNQAIGVYITSMGGITATVADVRLILAGALNVGATSIILCHNHPSGNTQPSNADIELTKKINNAAKEMSLSILDHVIITKNDYYSFVDNGRM